MLRLSTFCMLLAFAVAQSGYEYNKPGKPFSQGTTSNKNSYSPSPGGFQGPATTPSYKTQGVKGDDYSKLGGATPTIPPSSGYPSGVSQGFSNLGQQTQPGYSSQTPSGPSFSQVSSGPSSVFPGQTGSTYAVQGQTYPGNDQKNYPGQIGSPGQSGAPNGPNYPSQSGQTSGSPIQNPPGAQSYPGQPGRPGSPGQTDMPGFGPANGFGQPNAGFGQPNQGFGQANTGFGSDNNGEYEGGDYSAIPGEPDIDYPILTEIPTTSFRCDAQAYPGYYADVETRCQVFHVCANNRTYDFLCPNGTIFSQQVFVCVWWNQFDCNSAPGLYGLNADLYDYSKIGSAAQNAYQPGLNDYSQGQQGPSTYPGSAPGSQGPSANYPGSTGSQSLAGYPGGSGSLGYPGGSGPQGPAGNYPGASGTQSSFSGFSGSQEPTKVYPGSAPQSPAVSYPDTASQGPSDSYLVSGAQGASNSYPGSGGAFSSYPGSSQGQSNSYPASTPQGPSSSYPGSPPQGSSGPYLVPVPSSSYPGAAPQGTSSSYPGSASQGSPGYPGIAQGSSVPYPDSSVTPEYPSSGAPQNESPQKPSSYPASAPGGSQGYPSGKPSGPSFPTGGRPQQPNREYLPPRN